MVLKNVEAVLAASGLNFGHVVKTTIFLTSMNDFATVNEIYAQKFISNPPARSTVAGTSTATPMRTGGARSKNLLSTEQRVANQIC